MISLSTLRAGFAVLLLVGLASGCESITAKSDFDEQFDFRPYRTFSWISDRPMLAVSAEVNPLAQTRIQRAITNTLTSKGYQFTPDRNAADFVIAFTVGSRQQVKVNTYPAGFHRPYRWGAPYYTEVDVRQYTQGRLAIDIFDTKLKTPVWHGYATKNITGRDQANPDELVGKAVDAILAQFPPG